MAREVLKNINVDITGMRYTDHTTLAFANSVASICVTRRGAIPALPDLQETERFIRQYYPL